MRTYVRAVVRDRKGRIIRDTGWKETNTLTKNFYAFLRCAMQDADTPVTTVGGTIKVCEEPSGINATFMFVAAPAGNDSRGMVVGTGTTSPTRTDYNIESKIEHGTDSGQLYYYACEVTHSDDYVEITRTFGNESGADITIREIGIIAQYHDVEGYTRLALIARSLFEITVPYGSSVKIYYRITG